MKKNKKVYVGAYILFLHILVLMTGCAYHPPEGYTKKHHTYDEMVEYAKSIDPQSSVSEEYKDIEEDNREYRIWSAEIKGVECSVASASKKVYNDGFAAGEFSKTYYCYDTDYDFIIVQNILESHPDLGIIETDSISERFHNNDLVCSTLKVEELTNERFDELWDEYKTMNIELDKYPLHKAYWFEFDIDGNSYYFTEPTEVEKQKTRDQLIDAGELK